VRAEIRIRGIDLGAEVIAKCASHAVEDRAGGKDQAAARVILGFTGAERLERQAHHADCFRHGKQVADVGFG